MKIPISIVFIFPYWKCGYHWLCSLFMNLQGVSDQTSGQKAHELTTKNVCSLIRVELPTVTGARNSFGL